MSALGGLGVTRINGLSPRYFCPESLPAWIKGLINLKQAWTATLDGLAMNEGEYNEVNINMMVADMVWFKRLRGGPRSSPNQTQYM